MSKEKQRSYSTSSNSSKRKTVDTSFEEEDSFQTSKKIERSPVKSKDKVEEMENLARMMESIMAEIKEIRTENSEWKKDIKEMEEDMAKREEQWLQKFEKMKDKKEALEEKMEVKERQERRNKIVITGVNMENGRDKDSVEKFSEELIQVRTNVKEIRTVGKEKKIVIATIKSWEEKQKIMVHKGRKMPRIFI